MSVPNLEHVVRQVRAQFPEVFPDRHMLCAYGHAVLVRLHQADPRFGCLKKSPGQNHCMEPNFERRAVDVALFKTTGQIIDFIQSAGFGDGTTNAVAWSVGEEGEYTADDWFAPVGQVPEPEPEPEPDPNPPPELIADILERLTKLEQECATKRRVEDINEALVALADSAVRKPLPPVIPHTHRVGLFGYSFRTGGPE